MPIRFLTTYVVEPPGLSLVAYGYGFTPQTRARLAPLQDRLYPRGVRQHSLRLHLVQSH
ncbi:hypothetical protein I3U64_00565 [Mycobacteroides abscessus subsp. abscessus]|uniref:hypothetical protein n=1 Tax=Mycobacteroides abscessus TaxID=36809 RepID=UPI0013F4EBEE|nr:hypothetical protein [Mycobacteroides abscessus]MBN7458639.1 hypothetical protein [Mycobacteroides abscessus subsp. abscessus]